MHKSFFTRSLPALVVLVLAACNNSKATHPAASSAGDTQTLKVMSFNIEWGGTHVSFDKVVEAIQKADPDIVGIQEAEGNLQQLALRLGWHYDVRNYVISRYPLIDPPGADGVYILVESSPGKVVAVADVHLPSDPYGPDYIRDGATPAEAMALEDTTRLPKIQPYITALPPLAARGIPVFVTGDFNAPSHTDWTETTAKTRPSVRYPFAWPVSSAMANAGFTDSWRSLHLDAAAEPGLTWWAARPPLPEYTPTAKDPSDRIDFVWFSGPAEAQASTIVGEPGASGVTISVDPWPSDHRSVLSTFSVKPAPLPAFVTSEHRVYHRGDNVAVRYSSSDGSEAQLTLIAVDRGGITVEPGVRPADGHMLIPDGRLAPGHYRLSLARAGDQAPLTYDFWMARKDAPPQVAVLADHYAQGEPIGVRWQDAPGNRNDYVAIYPANESAEYEGGLAWRYVNAMPAGEFTLDASTVDSGWPVPPGRYVAYLVKDDGYESLAKSAEFTVTAAGQ